MEEKKVLLSARDLEVKFRVRSRILTAIRGISLDIYEDESLAIVGESAAGKSVFTKTFTGMLEENGFISNGSIIFNDPDVADTWLPYGSKQRNKIKRLAAKLNDYARLENGAEAYCEMIRLRKEYKRRFTLSEEQSEKLDTRIKDLTAQHTELFNLKQTIDPHKEGERYNETKAKLAELSAELKSCEKQRAEFIRTNKEKAKQDSAYKIEVNNKLAELQTRYKKDCGKGISDAVKVRNEEIAKEIYLSIGRYTALKRIKAEGGLLKALKKAMMLGVDLNDGDARTKVFGDVAFRVKLLEETKNMIHGNCLVDLAKIKYANDWTRIRGRRIATIFQDPMTSLNPILTIGKQISSIIIKHQGCSEIEARARAITLMKKVGIPNADSRYDDYPFQYSGGMRQRIVIAIALSCQPKILICDEPTTALDVTIQAQILKLIKDLQKEFHYTIVFITHDLGVVANIADRVAVLYAGQIVEVGMVDEIFYDPRHPYTWALLSSMPQLAQRDTKLFSISGTPPSLYNKIIGDPFAPRNQYCLKIDTLKAPPMFKVSDTHYAKTWLLDPRAPKVEKPEIIRNIHEKMIKAYRI